MRFTDQIEYTKVVSYMLFKDTATCPKNNKFDFISTRGTGNDELDELIAIAGYSYDPKQDIFYSNIDPWQRKVGYCRLNDIAAAPLGMIIDCEPIRFRYQNKNWMIGLWKGQYDLVTGGEIGVYTGAYDLNIFGIRGTFYNCASNDDLLKMAFVLKKNGITLFTRKGKHWWLTGFKLGEFSEPAELTMDIDIIFDNIIMRDAFATGLRNAGYSDNQFARNGNKVSLIFDIPHTPQPFSRIPQIDNIIQQKNKFLCDQYQAITGTSDNVRDKIKALEEQAPELYKKVIKIAKAKKSYERLYMFNKLLGKNF